MISLQLNEIPEELYQCLVKNAELHQRSLNAEILDCLAIQMFQSNIKNRSTQVSIRNLLSAEELKALLSTEDDLLDRSDTPDLEPDNRETDAGDYYKTQSR
ncbi:hypothetical protein HJG40_13475 [Acidithiobacillus sp. ATCC 19703]|uniref:Arc-like DNA binding domain-containing protein n=1 Tax=Acidithiobacillus concretivorus TaxID=3063952 RepID=A0ABS5ZT04_9PROT|nr:hypothetical protein [Acidithiobacillus concretivorus]